MWCSRHSRGYPTAQLWARSTLNPLQTAAAAALIAAMIAASSLAPSRALAQTDTQTDVEPSASDSLTSSWPGSFDLRGAIEDGPKIDLPADDGNTTVVPRQPPAEPQSASPSASEDGRLTLEAVLIEDGEPVGADMLWRIYRRPETSGALPELVEKLETAQPTVTLEPGTYFVNVAYGRAHLTRRINVLANGSSRERFVLNAGGLRAAVVIEGGFKPNPRSVSIDIYSDESDQSGQRQQVINDAQPGTVIRLNSGIYHIESHIGGANAVVRAEVSVEAGKLTEVNIVHKAAPITFKLVTEPGGEAIAGTRWTVITETGNVVRESMGALPTHVLAPGNYTVIAQWRGQTFRKTFDVESGGGKDVEVLSTPDLEQPLTPEAPASPLIEGRG